MLIHGTIIQNLESAIVSATRLRGRPVYAETLAHWNAVLGHAQHIRSDWNGTDHPSLDLLITRLVAELERRPTELPKLAEDGPSTVLLAANDEFARTPCLIMRTCELPESFKSHATSDGSAES